MSTLLKFSLFIYKVDFSSQTNISIHTSTTIHRMFLLYTLRNNSSWILLRCNPFRVTLTVCLSYLYLQLYWCKSFWPVYCLSCVLHNHAVLKHSYMCFSNYFFHYILMAYHIPAIQQMSVEILSSFPNHLLFIHLSATAQPWLSYQSVHLSAYSFIHLHEGIVWWKKLSRRFHMNLMKCNRSS